MPERGVKQQEADREHQHADELKGGVRRGPADDERGVVLPPNPYRNHDRHGERKHRDGDQMAHEHQHLYEVLACASTAVVFHRPFSIFRSSVRLASERGCPRSRIQI